MDASSLAISVLRWLATYLVHSTILLGVALLVDRLLSDRYVRVRETSLRIALVGGLLTASLQGPLELGIRAFPDPVMQPSASSVRGASGGFGGAPISGAPVAPPGIDVELASLPAGAPILQSKAAETGYAAFVPSEAAPRASAWTWAPLAALGAWTLGALALLLRRERARRRLREALADRRSVEQGPVRADLDRLGLAAGFSRPLRLTTVEGLSSPVALGVVRPEVCVPPRALVELEPSRRLAMLAHETAHHVRRDPLWASIAGLVSDVLFVQPLNLLATRRMHETSEVLCDAWAAERLGDGLPLAACLAEVAGWTAGVEPAVATAMATPGPLLTRRIERLLQGDEDRTPDGIRAKWGRRGVGIAGLLLVLGAAPTFASPEAASPATDSVESSPVLGLDSPVRAPEKTSGTSSLRDELAILRSEVASLDEEFGALTSTLAKANVPSPVQSLIEKIDGRRRALRARIDALTLPPAARAHRPASPHLPPSAGHSQETPR